MERVRLVSDEKAFNELHRRYARLLQGFFFRRLGGLFHHDRVFLRDLDH